MMESNNIDPTSSFGNGSIIHNPKLVDVLLGRGKPVQSHPGNQRMLRIVDEQRPRYFQAERKDKHEIIEEITRMIKECGGRFLARVDYENYWVEVSHSIAYRKVGHAFRSKVRISKNYSGGTTTTSALPNNMLSDAPTTTITTRQSFLMGMNLQLQQQPGFSLAASTTSPAVSINKCPPVLNQTSQFAFSSSLISYPTMHEPGMSSHSGSLNRFGTTSFGGLLPPNRSTTEALLHQQHLLGTLPRGAMGGMGSQGEIPPDVSSFQKTLAAHSFDTAAEVRAKLKLHTR